MNPPAGTETLNGSERIGWDQPAADAVELAAIRYAIYVDGARSELPGVSCAPASTAARFACTARVPALAVGAHALQIASFVVDGSLLESARSAPLNVFVAPASASATPPEPAIRPGEVRASDGSSALVEAIGAFDEPADLAVAPDGRLFVAERAGQIVIVHDGRAPAEPALALESLNGGRLIALALDPQFERTHFLYVLYTSVDRSSSPAFVIARMRESGGTLGDRIVVLDGVPASSAAAGALRFGPDGKLYAAFDAGADARRAGDAASSNGKVLRLNPDGTTPADQLGGTPVIVGDLLAPTGLAWQPTSGTLWIADRRDGRSAQLRAITGSAALAYALPADVRPTSIAFARQANGSAADTLLIGSDGNARVVRLTLGPRAARPSQMERLLQDRVDVVRALAVGPDGGIYFASSTSIGRIRDQGRAIP